MEAKYTTRVVEEAIVTVILTPDEASTLRTVLEQVEGSSVVKKLDLALKECVGYDYDTTVTGVLVVKEGDVR